MGVIYLPDPNAALQQQMIKDSKDLFEQFRQGGTRDQEKMRALLGQQALASGQQQMDLARTADARAADAAAQSTAANTQAFNKNAQDSANSKAVKSVGANRFTGDSPQVPLLPEDAFLSQWINPMAESANRFTEGTHADQNGRDYADLGEVGQRHLRDQSAAQHPLAQLSELQLGTAWNNDLGVRSKTAGNQVQSVQTGKDGESTTVATPKDVIDIAKKAEDAKLLAASGKGQNDRAESLLKDFRGEKTVQNYYGAKAAIDTIRRSVAASAKNPTGANDITLLTSFMRSIDPGSTVREGEFKTAAESGGLPDQVMGYYNKLTGQGRLTQEQRQQILAASEQNFQSHAGTMDAIRGQYAEHAAKLGVDSKYFAKDTGEPDTGAPKPSAPGSSGGAAALPPFNSVKELEGRDPSEVVEVVDAKGNAVSGTVAEHLAEASKTPPPAPDAPLVPVERPTVSGALSDLGHDWVGDLEKPPLAQRAGDWMAEQAKKLTVPTPRLFQDPPAATLPEPYPPGAMPAGGPPAAVGQIAAYLTWQRLHPNATREQAEAVMKMIQQQTR